MDVGISLSNLELEKRRLPFKQKHASFKAMLFPALSVVMIDTDMTELVDDRRD
jgi:hypothetical protein